MPSSELNLHIFMNAPYGDYVLHHKTRALSYIYFIRCEIISRKGCGGTDFSEIYLYIS